MLNNIKQKNNKRYILHFFIAFLLTIVITFIFGLYFYNTFMKFQINYSKLYNQNNIQKMKQIQDDMVKISNRIFSDNKVTLCLSKKSFPKTNPLQDTLKNIATKEYITNITVISKENNIALSSMGFYGTYEKYCEENKNHKALLDKYSENINVDSYVDSLSKNETLVFLYYDYRDYITLITVNTGELKNYLFNQVYPIFYNTLMTNSDDNILFTGNHNISEEVKRNIITKSKNGTVIYKNYLVIPKSSYGYSCISIIKISDIVNEAINSGTFITLIASFVFIFLLIILYYSYWKHCSLSASNKELALLQNNTKTDLLLRKVFDGNILSASEFSEITEYFQKNASNFYRTILIGIDNYNDFKSKNSYDDINLYKYGFENIIYETFENISKIKSINLSDDLIGIILYGDESLNLDAKISKKIDSYTAVIKENFSASLFTVVTPVFNSVDNMIKQIHTLFYAYNYKIIKQENETKLFINTLETNSKNVTYPQKLQLEIIQSLKYENMKEFENILNKFKEYMLFADYQHIKEWCLKLFLAISDSADKINTIHIKYNTLEKIGSCDNLNEMIKLIENSIELKNKETAQTLSKTETFISEITNVIEEHYRNPDFCMQYVIDIYSYSSSYFGKKFKDEFGVTFNKYLIDKRLHLAMKLLKETTYTNRKIAHLCGFNSENYFMTVFKKNIGITPKEYKQSLSN